MMNSSRSTPNRKRTASPSREVSRHSDGLSATKSTPQEEAPSTSPEQQLLSSLPTTAAAEEVNTPAIHQVARDADFKFHIPTKLCIHRIQSDLKSMERDPVDGILAVPDETCVNICHALITGPSDTPYEFGFFLFRLEFPDDYPHKPPYVTLLTTGGGVVRFNPNLYPCGKVCLSILGTWDGPGWSPAHTIRSVLLSIRSLMNSYPYQNEPGFEDAPIDSKEVRHYNHYIRYETLRIAVLDMVDMANLDASNFIPPSLASFICSDYLEKVEFCKLTCDEYSFLDGKEYRDKFSFRRGTFNFCRLKCLLEQRQGDYEAKEKATTTL